jgi:ATP-dependent Clp protease protease subunit
MCHNSIGQESSRRNNPQGEQKNKFWDFIPATATKPPELLLYGAISSNQSWWEDRVTPGQFNKELAALGEDVAEIIVRINSPGGDVFAANAIYTRLKDHPAKITVKIDGWAASAATIIAMAGDIIKIARNGVFMIHDPAMTVWDTFKEEDFTKLAQELKVIKQSIINTYAMKTGKTEQEISDFMSEESWWIGDAAVENGFCDELMFEESKMVVENANRIIVNSVPFDITNFSTIPKAILNSIADKGSFQADNVNPENKPKMEEKTMEIKKIDELKAAYPELITAIENNATEKERNRIKELQAAAVGGFEDIVNDAMFDNPVSAGEMALKILMKQKEQGGQYMKNLELDVEDSHVNNIGASAREKGGEAADPYNEAIDKLFPDTK